MSFRTENKYKIAYNKISHLYKWIKESNGIKFYPDRKVHSIYFDNDKFQSYHNSLEGVVPRKKIRFRYYNDETIFDKLIQYEEKISSIEGRFKFSKKTLINKDKFYKGIFDNFYGLCFPKTRVSYKREYFKVFNVRVTLDTNISYSEVNKYGFRKREINDKNFILEVKCDPNNNYFLDKKFNFEKIRFSKYCNSIEYLKIFC